MSATLARIRLRFATIIDPYMYNEVSIDSGVTDVTSANQAIGGAVSFRPKSADDYLSPTKSSYFGHQSNYDSANCGWHNGITATGSDEYMRGLISISRRGMVRKLAITATVEGGAGQLALKYFFSLRQLADE